MILLDTHVLVWAAVSPERLSRDAAAAIRRFGRGRCAIASISLWEIAFLLSRGRIRYRGSIEQGLRALLDATRVAIKDITPEIAALSQQFEPPFPSDPQDRLIAATAIAEGLPLVTADEAIRSCPRLRTIW